MKALVTGCAGFVGSRIVRRLLSDGYEVVGIDCITDYYDTAIKLDNIRSLVNENFTFIEQDLNCADLSLILQDVEYIFHEAGQPGVRKSWGKDFDTYIDANIRVTQALLEAAKNSKTLKKFVYASSSSVYGDAQTFPTTESQPTNPLSPYGVSKLAAENLCTLYGKNFSVPTVSLRYFTVYGPGQRPDMAFTRFVQAILTGGKVEIYGTGEQIRDFTYVDDIVESNIQAAVNPTNPGEVFNVAGGSNISVNDAIAVLEELAGTKLDVSYTTNVAGDVFRTGGCTEKIQKVLNWKPQVTIRDGLARHLEWGRRVFI